jgi:hypothetical protein
MWRGGCIIRSVFLKDITAAYRANTDLENLLFNDFFNKAIHKAQPGWRDVVAKAALLGIPTPAFSTALSWFDGYRTKDLPPTCSRLSVITSARTPSRSSLSLRMRSTRKERIFMSTGLDVVVTFQRFDLPSINGTVTRTSRRGRAVEASPYCLGV